MYCGKCGNKVKDGSKFCSKCGAPLASVPNTGSSGFGAQGQGKENMAESEPKLNVYQSDAGSHYGGASNTSRNAEDYPMGWYKFLIWVGLFGTALFSFINAINLFTGNLWGGGMVSDAVYSYFPGLRAVDVLTGLMLLGLTVFALVTRSRLANFRASAPKSVLALYATCGCVWLFWFIGVMASIGAAMDSMLGWGGSYIASAVAPYAVVAFIICGGMIAWNYDYFKKRAALFVN